MVFTQRNRAAAGAKARSGGYPGSLLRVGRAQASHPEWIHAALQELRSEAKRERIGVWLEEPSSRETPDGSPILLRGEAWEEGTRNEVLEWARLPLEAPLRVATLRAGLGCEYEIARPITGAVLGPELQLRRVLWIPVIARRILCGLVMMGSLEKQRALPWEQAERIADQLGILLEHQKNAGWPRHVKRTWISGCGSSGWWQKSRTRT